MLSDEGEKKKLYIHISCSDSAPVPDVKVYNVYRRTPYTTATASPTPAAAAAATAATATAVATFPCAAYNSKTHNTHTAIICE